MYCHSLTDPTILGPAERAAGRHTLTLFGLHTPAELYRADPAGTREEAVRRVLAQLDAHLEEPLADCLARDAQGRPCLSAASPLDVEAALAMPGGHIFHGDLAWPVARTTGRGRDVGRGHRAPSGGRRLLRRDGPRRRGERAGRLRGGPAPAGPAALDRH